MRSLWSTGREDRRPRGLDSRRPPSSPRLARPGPDVPLSLSHSSGPKRAPPGTGLLPPLVNMSAMEIYSIFNQGARAADTPWYEATPKF